MKSEERYRAKAAESLGRAEAESSPVCKAEFENLASAYLRLDLARVHNAAAANNKIRLTFDLTI